MSIKRKPWTEEEDAAVKASFSAGYGHMRALAKQLGRSAACTLARRRKFGYTSQTNVNENFFDQWSPLVAYVLGYIWADGSLYCIKQSNGCFSRRLCLRCTATDGHLIDRIADAMSFTGERRITKGGESMLAGKKIKQKPLRSIAINNTKIVDCLMTRHGIPQNKSGVDPCYPQIPDQYVADFARGYFDGDGTVGPSKSKNAAMLYFYGSDRFVNGLRDQLQRVIGVIGNVYNNRALKVLIFARRASVTALYRAFYADHEAIYLDRKRQKILSLMPSLMDSQSIIKHSPLERAAA